MSSILILHPNYPAQFKLHCEILTQLGHKVVFVAQSASVQPIAGVKLYVLQQHLGFEALHNHCSDEVDRSLMRSRQYLEMFWRLHLHGFVPDLAISHSGWGCGRELKTVWPSTKVISYLEWWFQPNSALSRYENRPPMRVITSAMQPKLDARNELLLEEALQADVCVTPTQWQRSQFPPSLQARCVVIHEGVDIAAYAPNGKPQAPSAVITYGTRGFESMRGFPDLITELRTALAAFPMWSASIAGEDRSFYSPTSPSFVGDSLGEWARNQLQSAQVLERVQFVNRLPAGSYRDWLSLSSLHIYLTQPFVASWSLVEAMASGALLVVSNVEPVKEIVPQNSAIFVDHRCSGWLHKLLSRLDEEPQYFDLIRASARRSSLRFSSVDAKRAWLGLICQLIRT